jgi:hypothetical protein
MYIRKRGQFYHYEFFVNGNRYTGSFNGKNGAKTAANKKKQPNSRTRSVARYSMALSAMKWSGRN